MTTQSFENGNKSERQIIFDVHFYYIRNYQYYKI